MVAARSYGYTKHDWARLNGPSEGDDDPRSPFARDYDRLIYTSAFRRLQGKTQVVTPGEADFFRTRLTHTIEVAQVARRIAETLNRRAADARAEAGTSVDADLDSLPAEQQQVDPDLCEAAAVLHDLGHPPFGHVGEDALREAIADEADEWGLADAGSFDGNAQSFRLAARTIAHKRRGGGLQLTRAVLDAAIKYPWEHKELDTPENSSRKWSAYATEREQFGWVRERVPADLRHAQSLEAQIMDWADNVAYSVHDLDDWFRAGFMPLARLARDADAREFLIERICERWERDGRFPDADARRMVRDRIRGILEDPEEAFHPFRLGSESKALDPGSDAAREAFRMLRGLLLDEFIVAGKVSARTEAAADLSRRYRLQFEVEESSKLKNSILRELLWVYVIGDPRMATHQDGHKRVADALLRRYSEAARSQDPDRLGIFPFDVRDDLAAAPDPRERFRLVVDYVSGMTDAFALRRHARLSGTGGPFQEFV